MSGRPSRCRAAAEASRALPLGNLFKCLEQRQLRHALRIPGDCRGKALGEAALCVGDSSPCLRALRGAVVKSNWQFQLKRDYRFLLTSLLLSARRISLLSLEIRFC